MNKDNFIDKFRNFHFIGIGGISMSALAKYMLKIGKCVSGSDITANLQTEELALMGATIYIRHSKDNVKNADAVIYTSAISEDNAELIYAKRQKIPIFKRSEVLGEIIKSFPKSVAISGSHGKTTATAMIANVLTYSKRDVAVFLGGEDYSFSNFKMGKKIFVTEACEYKKNILDIKPSISVVLNVDEDHMECYKNVQELIGTFSTFAKHNLAVVNSDDKNCKKIFNSSTVTFGIDNLSCYTAKRIKKKEMGYSFAVYAYGIFRGRINLNIEGKHNVYNALSAFVVCDLLGIDFKNIKGGLENFKGVKRRNETLGELSGLKFIADYAHHPREIKAFLSMHEEIGDDFMIVFQPHTYSRTEYLMEEFIGVLKDKKTVVIYKTYPAREKYNERGSAKTLYEKLKKQTSGKVYYAENEDELLKIIEKEKGEFRSALFIGAGDIYEKAKKLLFKRQN